MAVGLVILFEEWGWEPLQRAMAALGRAPPLRRIEAAIVRLPPAAAIVVFAAPSLLLLPVKIVALWLIAHGHGVLGVATIVFAKIAGTAIVARLFVLTRPALLRLGWFAAAYERWTRWKDALLAAVRASAAWRTARLWRLLTLRRLRALLRP